MHKNHVKYKVLCTICMQKSICVSTRSVKYIHDIYKGDHSGLWVPDFCPKTCNMAPVLHPSRTSGSLCLAAVMVSSRSGMPRASGGLGGLGRPGLLVTKVFNGRSKNPDQGSKSWCPAIWNMFKKNMFQPEFARQPHLTPKTTKVVTIG